MILLYYLLRAGSGKRGFLETDARQLLRGLRSDRAGKRPGDRNRMSVSPGMRSFTGWKFPTMTQMQTATAYTRLATCSTRHALLVLCRSRTFLFLLMEHGSLTTAEGSRELLSSFIDSLTSLSVVVHRTVHRVFLLSACPGLCCGTVWDECFGVHRSCV